MCFYDQNVYACGCYRWGHFQHHCHKEYRIGETCGMKILMATHQIDQNCRLCRKIDAKKRTIKKESKRIKWWGKEGNRNAATEKSREALAYLKDEILCLELERSRQRDQMPRSDSPKRAKVNVSTEPGPSNGDSASAVSGETSGNLVIDLSSPVPVSQGVERNHFEEQAERKGLHHVQHDSVSENVILNSIDGLPKSLEWPVGSKRSIPAVLDTSNSTVNSNTDTSGSEESAGVLLPRSLTRRSDVSDQPVQESRWLSPQINNDNHTSVHNREGAGPNSTRLKVTVNRIVRRFPTGDDQQLFHSHYSKSGDLFDLIDSETNNNDVKLRKFEDTLVELVPDGDPETCWYCEKCPCSWVPFTQITCPSCQSPRPAECTVGYFQDLLLEDEDSEILQSSIDVESKSSNTGGTSGVGVESNTVSRSKNRGLVAKFVSNQQSYLQASLDHPLDSVESQTVQKIKTNLGHQNHPEPFEGDFTSDPTWQREIHDRRNDDLLDPRLELKMDDGLSTANRYNGKMQIMMPEDSDVESIASAIDSIFSGFTSSSISSVGTIPGANERLKTLFTTDDLQVSYSQIFQVIGNKALEDELRHLLKRLALNLRKEASIELEKRAAGYLLHRARNLAHTISGELGKGKEVASPEEQDSEIHKFYYCPEDEESETEDVDEDALSEESPAEFLWAEQFIRQSNSLSIFKNALCGLVEKSLARQVVEELAIDDPIDPHWSKTIEVKWKCGCGKLFSEEVIEYRPGAAQELAPFSGSTGDTSVDIEHLAGSIDITAATRGIVSLQTNQQHPNSQSAGTNVNSGCTESKDNDITVTVEEVPKDKEFILFCKQQESEKSLYHADITTALCDYTSYHILHAKYHGFLAHPWLKWLNFKEIRAVDFVKFHLFYGTYVSIDNKDIGVLPPPSLGSEYRYTHCTSTNIPVLKTALRHFIQHPSHAEKQPRDRPKIPKKVREELVLMKELGSKEGYGLYIQEGICWNKVCIVEAVFATMCVAFAVFWCVRNRGGIQDGFTIAGTGIAYSTILLAALQAVSQKR